MFFGPFVFDACALLGACCSFDFVSMFTSFQLSLVRLACRRRCFCCCDADFSLLFSLCEAATAILLDIGKFYVNDGNYFKCVKRQRTLLKERDLFTFSAVFLGIIMMLLMYIIRRCFVALCAIRAHFTPLPYADLIKHTAGMNMQSFKLCYIVSVLWLSRKIQVRKCVSTRNDYINWQLAWWHLHKLHQQLLPITVLFRLVSLSSSGLPYCCRCFQANTKQKQKTENSFLLIYVRVIFY